MTFGQKHSQGVEEVKSDYSEEAMTSFREEEAFDRQEETVEVA